MSHDFIPQSAIRNSQFLGAPGRARTCGIRIRSPTLYPAELRALVKPLKLQRRPTSTVSTIQNWGERRGLNPRPPGPQPGALPTELRPPCYNLKMWIFGLRNQNIFYNVGCTLSTNNRIPQCTIRNGMVRLKGLEPLAHSLEGCCSIHLSYRRFNASHIVNWKLKS